MHRSILLLILLSLLVPSGAAAAPAPQDERRIEEQKREGLEAAKARPQKPEEPLKTSPLQPDDMIYLAEMSFREVTYGYDLCKMAVILRGVDEQYIGLDAQAGYLKDEGLLPKNLRDAFDPMKPLRRGAAAYALSRVLDVKGGIFMNIFKESQRYALKELAYEGVMSSGNINAIISGDELAATITRAIDHLENR